MNGYLRVNTFLRDVAFINCQNIKTVCFHVNYFEARKEKHRVNTMLFYTSLGLLRDKATRENKKLLGNNWDNFSFSAIMHSYVTSWGVYNGMTGTVLHIYATNIPENEAIGMLEEEIED